MDGFAFRARLVVAGGVSFARFRCSHAFDFVRDERHATGRYADFVTINYYLHGGVKGSANGLPITRDTSAVTLFDQAGMYAGESAPHEVLGVIVPKQLLEGVDRLFAHTIMHAWPRASIEFQFYESALLGLWRVLDETADAADVERALPAFLGVVNGLLRSTRARLPEPGAHAQMFAAMHACLFERLSLATLDSAWLAAEFGCSRSTVYRVFEHVGGVARLLREERLRRAYQMLLSMQPGERVDSTVLARECGYRSPQGLRRAFHKRFGMYPDEFAALRVALDADITVSQPNADEIERLHRLVTRHFG